MSESVSVGEIERGRGRERDRQTDKRIDTQTVKQIDRDRARGGEFVWIQLTKLNSKG